MADERPTLFEADAALRPLADRMRPRDLTPQLTESSKKGLS
jgi:hypothetical protein